MCLFAFPIIGDESRKVFELKKNADGEMRAIEEENGREVEELVLLLAYLSRAYNVEEYVDPQRFAGERRVPLLKRFLRKYTRKFGKWNCTPNFHMFSHAELVTELAPGCRTSTFRNERSYAPLKKCFVHGRKARLSGIMKGVFLRHALQHSCKKTIKYGSLTELTDDTLIYCGALSDAKCYKITEVMEGKCFKCLQYQLLPYTYECPGSGTRVDFTAVGCYVIARLGDAETVVMEENVSGKCIIVEDKIVTVPLELIHELF